MDLRSENPYWLLKNGLIKTYPSLQQNIKADVVVVGAGITGALTAWHLCKAGFRVVIVDKRHIGMASTSACTGLLQYEIDTPLHVLSEKVGESNAILSYKLCRDAIYTIEKICKNLSIDCEFGLKPSFQFASFKKDIKSLRLEYEMRKKNGFEIEWLNEQDIQRMFGFVAPAGLLSKDGAFVNAYSFTHALLDAAVEMGLEVFDHTKIINLTDNRTNTTLTSDNGHTIAAKKIVIACGYESQQYLSKKVETWHSTYAIISEPLNQSCFWYENALIWETATPYLYIRTTIDNRILVGGLDDDFYSPSKRDVNLESKAKTLYLKFNKRFPEIRFKTDFKWAGTFASTKDGLPYIGTTADMPNIFFALGYGGNGITFSLIAAEIIKEALLGHTPITGELFSFTR